jgi:ferritin-like metal-binding protein YciE
MQPEKLNNNLTKHMKQIENELNDLRNREIVNQNKIPTITKTEAKQKLINEGDTILFIDNNRLNIGLKTNKHFLTANIPLMMDSTY